jgi:hypothetical protein
MAMELDDGLLTEAVVGKQVEEFLGSDIGQAMLTLAEQEAQEAMDELKKIHPTQQDQIRELQNRIWRAEKFEGWLAGLIRDGQQAVTQLRQQRSEEREDGEG